MLLSSKWHKRGTLYSVSTWHVKYEVRSLMEREYRKLNCFSINSDVQNKQFLQNIQIAHSPLYVIKKILFCTKTISLKLYEWIFVDIYVGCALCSYFKTIFFVPPYMLWIQLFHAQLCNNFSVLQNILLY
jgi:hypothetical protein